MVLLLHVDFSMSDRVCLVLDGVVGLRGTSREAFWRGGGEKGRDVFLPLLT